MLGGLAARADNDSGKHEDSDDGYVVNDASKVAFAQSFVGLSETKQASVVGLRYAAAFNTKYVAAKGDLSSQMSLSFKLERGMNGGFTLWSLSGDDRDDTNHPASLKISYVARGGKSVRQPGARGPSNQGRGADPSKGLPPDLWPVWQERAEDQPLRRGQPR